MRTHVLLIRLCLCLLAVTARGAETRTRQPAPPDHAAALRKHGLRTWTNVAGHALEGELVAFDGQTVTLRLKSGSRRALGIDSFCAADRDSLRGDQSLRSAPPAIKTWHQHTRAEVRRARQFHAGGKIDEQELARRLSNLVRVFRLACEQHRRDKGSNSKLPAEVEARLVEQLLARARP